jgi:hypothetical protein
MDLSDPKTWTDGFWLVVSAPHIAGPLVVAVGTAVWFVRGKLEQSSAANQAHPLQLLLKLGTMLMKHFVNPLSQVHERFNGHPC